MTSSNIVTGFNDHFIEFVNDIIMVFPDNHDILSAKNSLLLIRKTNPRLLIQIWHTYVVEKYKSYIEDGNIDFFISNDYSMDLANFENSKKIIDCIDRLRNPLKLMSPENRSKSIKYIQNLTKLSEIHKMTTTP